VKGTIQFGYLHEGNGGGAYDCREPVVIQRIRSIAWFVLVWIAFARRLVATTDEALSETENSHSLPDRFGRRQELRQALYSYGVRWTPKVGQNFAVF